MASPAEAVRGRCSEAAQQVLEDADLVGLVLARLLPLRRGGYTGQATSAARSLCLTSKAIRAAVLAAVRHVRMPLASLPALRHMAASLASLALDHTEPFDPSQLPALPQLTRLDCSLSPQAASRTAPWRGLSKLQQLALVLPLPGQQRLPAAVQQLPQLTRLEAQVQSHRPLAAIMELSGLRSLELEGSMGEPSALSGISQLSCLSSLALRFPGMWQLHEVVGRLTALGSLDLRDCRSLQRLPDSIGQLTALRSLDLAWCSSLQQLPDSIGQLTALGSLDLAWCSSLQQLPDSIGQLTALRWLDLGRCSSLQQLPASIAQLTALSSLYLSGCSSLQQLPASIGQLTALGSRHLPW
jgi:Leucine-rich repeat (LRR) protein